MLAFASSDGRLMLAMLVVVEGGGGGGGGLCRRHAAGSQWQWQQWRRCAVAAMPWAAEGENTKGNKLQVEIAKVFTAVVPRGDAFSKLINCFGEHTCPSVCCSQGRLCCHTTGTSIGEVCHGSEKRCLSQWLPGPSKP